jgi:hypothetical protein
MGRGVHGELVVILERRFGEIIGVRAHVRVRTRARARARARARVCAGAGVSPVRDRLADFPDFSDPCWGAGFPDACWGSPGLEFCGLGLLGFLGLGLLRLGLGLRFE